jgi:carboxyl-terminal processing protease
MRLTPAVLSSALAAFLFGVAAAPSYAQDAPGPAGQVEPAEPAEPVEPVEPSEPSEPVEPVEPAEPVEPVETAARADARSDEEASSLPLAEIRRYVAVYNAIRQAYVDPVEDAELMQSAIRGLLLDLDPHSAYLDRRDAENFNERATGAYDGIGVELLRQPDRTLLIIAPIDDTPAARAGIKAGDVVVAIDGKPVEDGSEASEPLRGPPGSSVVLTIRREGHPEPLDITVVRDTIRVASVRGRMLEPGFGYVRVSVFQADTGSDFATRVDGLKAEAGGRLRGLVIDLRSNPGGLLTTAVQIADELLDRGTIVSTRGRLALSDTKFSATPGDRIDGAPVVVLVDAGSASASEVLAGALRDHDRARVVGSRTFGKGSVQTVLPLDNGDSVKLTTARYYTPDGISIQARGIEPDVVLRAASADAANDAPGAIVREASLPRHLRGDAADGKADETHTPGEVLEGEGPIAAALAELKLMVAGARRPARGTAEPRDAPTRR